jgi:hypothetical protein
MATSGDFGGQKRLPQTATTEDFLTATDINNCMQFCSRSRDPASCNKNCEAGYRSCIGSTSTTWHPPPPPNCAQFYQRCVEGCNGDPDCECYCLQGYQRCRHVPVMPC